MAETGKDIPLAAALLQQGELVAIPTETVYGLAANALNPTAVAHIFEVKNRPAFNPLIVHCASVALAWKYAKDVPDKAHKLANAFWPGPLTLILPCNEKIPDIVTAGNAFVGLRVPNHPLTMELLQCLDFPLAAPSANPFGYISPTTAAHVAEQLGDKIPYILDGGSCAVGVESTIVSFATGEPVLLRFGGISAEAIEKCIGKILYRAKEESLTPLGPGQLASHYAPSKKLFIGNLNQLVLAHAQEKIATISLSTRFEHIPDNLQFTLSPKGDLNEAAHNIFSALREADKLDVACILAEWMPEEGLGRAINDRLKRASA